MVSSLSVSGGRSRDSQSFGDHGKNGFDAASKLGTKHKIFVAATKNFDAATKRFIDKAKHFVVVTKCFRYPYFNK